MREVNRLISIGVASCHLVHYFEIGARLKMLMNSVHCYDYPIETFMALIVEGQVSRDHERYLCQYVPKFCVDGRYLCSFEISEHNHLGSDQITIINSHSFSLFYS